MTNVQPAWREGFPQMAGDDRLKRFVITTQLGNRLSTDAAKLI
ncbi:MAG: hypothetical protein R3C01_09085 [Planctomycetaceae bacterium]